MSMIFGALRCVGVGCRGSNSYLIQRKLITLTDGVLSPMKRPLNTGKNPAHKKTFTPRHQWDNVPKDFVLVFDSNVKHYIGGFRLGVAFVAVATIGFSLAGSEHFRTATREELKIMGAAVAIVSIGIVVTNVGSRPFFKRIYHHPNSGMFIAVRRTCLGRRDNLQYKVQDVVHTPEPGEKLHEGAEVKIHRRKVNLGAADFITPSYYNMHLDAQNHDLEERSQFGGHRF